MYTAEELSSGLLSTVERSTGPPLSKSRPDVTHAGRSVDTMNV